MRDPGERKRDGAHVGGAGMVPRRAAARGGGAAASRRRRLPRAGDDEEPRAAARAVGVLGAAQTLHSADHAGGELLHSYFFCASS